MDIAEPKSAIAVFETLGFDTQAVGFSRVFADKYFHELIPQLRESSDVAKILCYSPTLFAMHRNITPAKGALMIRCFDEMLALSEDEFGSYCRYYPKNFCLLCVRAECC